MAAIERLNTPALKAYWVSLILFVALLLGGASTYADKLKLTSVADLRYGVALYDYYQGEYMDAMSELMVAEARGGIRGHGDNPKIMEGGFALTYGLERHASDIFERLLDDNRPANVRDTAWFYLAKMRARAGDWQRSQLAIDNFSAEPPENLRNDAEALRINALIQLDKLDEAKALFAETALNSDWTPYINFNIGSALAKKQQYAQAVPYFDALGLQYYSTNEHRALYDKAMTAAGYALLFDKKYEQAIERFTKVRLTSALSNRAMLGYGWAAMALEDYQRALVPWTHLATSSIVEENSQEALIALPYAYEKLGADGLALTHHQQAEQKFIDEIARIDDAIVNLNPDLLLDTLKIKKSKGFDWLSYAQENQISPRLSYLRFLFAREEFQRAVQDLRDLLATREQLQNWQQKLQFYQVMLDERDVSRTERAKKINDPELKKQLTMLRQQRAAHAQKLEKIDTEQDYFALLDGDDAKLVERIHRLEKNLTLLKDDMFIDEYREAYRRYRGILLWQASEQYADNWWHKAKALRHLNRDLDAIDQNFSNVQSLLASAPDVAPFRARISDKQTQIAQQLSAINTLMAERQLDLSQQLTEVLTTQRARLVLYLGQCRLSIARLFDKGNRGEER